MRTRRSFLSIDAKYYHRGVSWKDLSRFVSKLSKDFAKDLEKIRKEAAMDMSLAINASRKRIKGKGGLAEYFERQSRRKYATVRKYKDEIRFGVGKISVLKRKYPYYLAINFGSPHIIGLQVPRGIFGDGKPVSNSTRLSRWKRNSLRNYSFISKRGIPAMHYIDKANAKLMPKFNEMWVKYKSEHKYFKGGLKYRREK